MGKRYILAFVATLFLSGLNSSCRNSSGPIPIVATPTALYISGVDNVVTVPPIPKEQLLEIDTAPETQGSLSTATSVPIKSSKGSDSKREGVHLSPHSNPTFVPNGTQPSAQGLENRIVPTPTPPYKSSVTPITNQNLLEKQVAVIPPRLQIKIML